MVDFVHWITTNRDFITSWTAILAIVASTVSIAIAVSNMRMQRAHYRKTVMPFGNLSMGDYENQLFVRLRNDGVGPMIVDGVSILQNENGAKIGEALIDLMPRDLLWATFVKNISGRAFAPGKDIDLILFDVDEADPASIAARQSIRAALSKLSVKVEYHSIYGEKFLAQRSLDWFGRHA
ncbi:MULTISPECIES: hypothetical protein [unclassified Bradyrhizobium]|uniref:hypothetical protein n=1 Tax=unclassified Bradyrhizobium TaxID=2631580 RepID=UPI0028E65D74|nr:MULTISPECIES: hypothetical protein [unclassified Bradyrhizobium]